MTEGKEMKKKIQKVISWLIWLLKNVINAKETVDYNETMMFQ